MVDEGGGASRQQWTLAAMKEYFEAILKEQRTATYLASQEREKSAAVLADSLATQIKAGDAALERHIDEQIRQIRDIIVGQRVSVDAAFAASEKAIAKAEQADSTRFDSFNEFNQRIDTILANTATRDSVEALKDAQRNELSALSDKLVGEIQRNREDVLALAKRIDVREGQAVGSKITTGILVTIVTVGVGVIGLIVVLANYISSH